MSFKPKRQLPNVNNQKIRQLVSINIEDDDQQITSAGDKLVHSRSGRHSSERKSKREEQQQRKLIPPIPTEEDKTFQIRTKSNKHIYESHLQNTSRQSTENDITRSLLAQQNSINIRESAKSIRESVTQLKDELMQDEIKRRKHIQKEEELSSLFNRRRRPGIEQDNLQIENEYLIQQQSILSKSTALNEMLSFKKELERSERKREQLSDHLESLTKTCNEKERLVSKMLIELKEVTENCDTYERQNIKLQHDLTLALEKLEQMTLEAERFAQESLNSQKQLADSEQKREEFKIQSQETIKQWNSRVKKLEKDAERYKVESTQMTEKNDELIKEIDQLKSQNFNLKEQIIKIESEFNETNINYNRFQEQFRHNENNVIQLRTIRSSQDAEITTFRGTVNQLQNQLSTHRQRLSQIEKENRDLQDALEEETRYRNNLHEKFKQSQLDNETLNRSYSQLQHERTDFLQKLKELEHEKDILLKDKSKYLSMETDYLDVKKKLETTKMEYTRGMKALQMDYENKMELLQLQLTDEKSQNTIFQRHEFEHKKEIDRLQNNLAKCEDEHTQQQYTIETLTREINDKSRLINEFESKINKLTTELTNQKNEILKKDKDYQNSLQNIYEDLINSTENLSNQSSKPFTIEPVTNSYDDIEIWSSKFKAHLTWLKQELDIRLEEELKLRENLNNALIDCEKDRKYFSSELEKRELLLNQLTDYSQQTIQHYDQPTLLTENETDHIDHRYRQFQIMIDSVKREIHTAKVQLLS